MSNDARAPSVLIVEDERKLALVVAEYLEAAGYVTAHVADGDAAVPHVQASSPSLVLLDLMLPGKDGLAICREIRAFSDVPIIMLTARVAEIDRLLGLDLGADDYVCKPFSPREVVARVRAVLRRTNPATTSADSARISVDSTRFEASLDGHRLDLTPVEIRLLEALTSQPGRIFSRDQLLDRLYNDRRVVLDRTVDSHVRNLRRKLSEVAPGEELIRSIYGLGYKLEFPSREGG